MRWSDRRGGEGREDAAAVDKPLRQTHEKQGLGVLDKELCLLTSHVTRHSSHVTRHTSRDTRHTSHVTRDSRLQQQHITRSS